jgi:hypothetical protein
MVSRPGAGSPRSSCCLGDTLVAVVCAFVLLRIERAVT